MQCNRNLFNKQVHPAFQMEYNVIATWLINRYSPSRKVEECTRSSTNTLANDAVHIDCSLQPLSFYSHSPGRTTTSNSITPGYNRRAAGSWPNWDGSMEYYRTTFLTHTNGKIFCEGGVTAVAYKNCCNTCIPITPVPCSYAVEVSTLIFLWHCGPLQTFITALSGDAVMYYQKNNISPMRYCNDLYWRLSQAIHYEYTNTTVLTVSVNIIIKHNNMVLSQLRITGTCFYNRELLHRIIFLTGYVKSSSFRICLPRQINPTTLYIYTNNDHDILMRPGHFPKWTVSQIPREVSYH